MINVPDPSTAQLNRYFTVEFVKQLRSKLAEGGVASFSLLAGVDYYGAEARQISSIFYRTLESAFANVLIVPGIKNYYLASDRPLRIDIAQMVQERGLQNVYVNSYYLDDALLKQRSDDLLQGLAPAGVLNRDFAPVAYCRQISYWLSYFHFSLWWIGGALLLLSFWTARDLNPISFGMFTGGFSASSLEILLLISFQVIYGYVYQATGLIITLFMAGLAAGAALGKKKSNRIRVEHFIAAQAAVGAYALVLPAILYGLKDSALPDIFIHLIFAVLPFTIALGVGFEFCAASVLRRGEVGRVASELYSIDLVGSAWGALLITTVLLPLLGIAEASIAVASLSFLSAAITFFTRKRYASAAYNERVYV